MPATLDPASLTPAMIAALPDARAWPFEEARRLIQRLDRMPGGKDKTVIFETGYGPSGLPHIGTFGEVARTSMVRHAFEALTEGKRKTRLYRSSAVAGARSVHQRR
jgi:lysyl-tRNA synthetase, class I